MVQMFNCDSAHQVIVAHDACGPRRRAPAGRSAVGAQPRSRGGRPRPPRPSSTLAWTDSGGGRRDLGGRRARRARTAPRQALPKHVGPARRAAPGRGGSRRAGVVHGGDRGAATETKASWTARANDAAGFIHRWLARPMRCITASWAVEQRSKVEGRRMPRGRVGRRGRDSSLDPASDWGAVSTRIQIGAPKGARTAAASDRPRQPRWMNPAARCSRRPTASSISKPRRDRTPCTTTSSTADPPRPGALTCWPSHVPRQRLPAPFEPDALYDEGARPHTAICHARISRCRGAFATGWLRAALYERSPGWARPAEAA